MNPPEDTNAELESFREQWRREVREKKPASGSQLFQNPSQAPVAAGSSSIGPNSAPRHHEPPRKAAGKNVARHEDEDDFVQLQTFDESEASSTIASKVNDGPGHAGEKQLVSALDHYEKAVEKEAVGSLGDSLRLYRKAFRMDDAVDLQYRNKHFPRHSAPKPSAAGSSGSAAAATAGGSHATQDAQPQSMKELIASFAGLAIEPAHPEIEGKPPPPCPIADLPEEILVHILRDIAILDVGDFVRLSQVCKRFAYLVASENRIWRRVCLGSEFGFGGMHYHWQKQISWQDLTTEDLLREIELAEDDGGDVQPLTLGEHAEHHATESLAKTLALFSSVYGSSWQRMFRLRPRIRFNGCYISTVNYIRQGQASVHSVTWNSPVHIVTYYRYLRFFRDGTVISLLTTSEPADVVHQMTREALALHASGANAHLPSIVMQSGLKGRWRLATAADNAASSTDIGEVEGDLVVETEGVRNYMYRLDLSLRSAGKGAKNNKLVWRGFYSYNRLTDDWAEFGLKNDKAYFFSRVKSYGIGS